MTSIAINSSAPQANTKNANSSSVAHARTPSISGQSTSAAVPANAPAARALSYANAAAISKKPPTGPGAASSSNTAASSQVSGGVSGQHARSASTTSAPVNGSKIQPAVPQIGNSGNSIANGASTPYSGGQHSRKSSIATGPMPNGASRNAPNIKFGTLNETGSGPQHPGTAIAAGSNLTAPVANNPRVSSPSPSAASQPVASGGVPSANTPRPIQFGDTTPQQRPMSLPPLPHVPQGPGSMASRGHIRHDSTQSSHTDSGPAMPHGRGMQINRRGGGGGTYNPQFQNQSYGYSRGGGYQGPSQQRNGPTNMGGAPPYPQQQYPNSPRPVPRSPALAHVQAAHHSPSMGAAVPTTSQLYPPAPHGQPFIPGSPYPPGAQMYQDPTATAYYAPHYQMAFTPQYAQTSPRPHFAQATPPYNPYVPQVQAQPMSRTSSANVPDIHARPPSSIGQHPQPPMTSQPPHMVSPPQAGTPGPAVPSPFNRQLPPKKPITRAVEIKNPDTGMTLKIEKAAPSPVVASTPIIVSSPSPAHGRASSRPEAPHSRSTSRSNKTTEEKRQEMRDKVAKAVEDQKRKDTEAEAERLRKEEEEKLKAEAEAKAKAQAEEDVRREAEEKERIKAQAEAEAAAKEAAEKKAAEEKALKEAEEQALREAEEQALREAEEQAQREAEEQAQREAKEQAQREADEKAAKEAEEAKAKADAEAEASKVAKAMADADKTAPSTPIVTPVSTPKASTPDSDAMPPPKQQPRSKPSPLNLQIKTNEPGPPSAALTALRSARPVKNLEHLQYPEGIQSPNLALNPMASTTKFKYDKEFLMQFQTVFTEKPSVDWDLKIRETVGDTDSARPNLSRPPSQMGPRSTSSRGSNSMPMQGTMGSFGSGVFPKPALTSIERFNNSPKPQSPINMINSLGMSRPSGLNRSGSSTSLSGSASNANPQSPRTGNRSARSSRRGAGGAGGSPMERSDSRQQSSQPTIPLADVKPLPVSANRWKPSSVRAAASSEPAATAPSTADNLLSPEMVQRKVKAALNKMTPEKFDKISDQILEITGQSKHESDGRTLRQVIQLTFEKATDEAHWASMYAKFCKRMLETIDPSIKDENIKDKAGVVVTGGNLFRKYLLNRCQEEFERGWKVNLPPAPEGVTEEVLMLSDEYYIAAAAKRRGLGLVQFIGELFKLNMLTERIMNECVRKLLDFDGLPEDETVESLTKLLRTIGSQLDNSEKSKPIMELYFGRINSLVENKDLNSRMRFMLMDIIDLRKKGWESKETNKGPKTIQEVHEEALKAQQEKEAASRANRGSHRPQGGRGDARTFSSGGGGYGMHPPGNSGGTVNPDDLQRLRAHNRQTNSRPSTNFGPTSLLGPRGSGSGSRRSLGPNLNRDDSSPSSRTVTPPAPTSTSSPNMFNLLNEAHADGNDVTSPPPSNANSPQVSSAKPVTADT
ncbi:hypothetical protein BDD12DRAFT_806565 [Trichophaea hybrida]|nr:hypothetical protein BDD12DRAFT_806565 [Trichophaea hybrida]